MADWDTSAALGGHLRNQNATAEKKPKNEHRWIWFVTGPTACGKTTVAKALARELEFTYVEGDDVSFLLFVFIQLREAVLGKGAAGVQA